MIKITTPESFGFDESIFALVKVARRGFIGSDFNALVKRAGFQFADMVRRNDWREGEIPVHMYALGCSEKYGSNRNADYFPARACEKYHDTFVKLGRFYRDHFNKDKTKSYGIVKESCFNKAAGRVELLVVLNGNKAIADENKGFVADKEMQKLASGKDISVSMSCLVPYDYCTSCNNAAKSRKEYCLGDDEGGHCKHGGLRHRIGRVCEDGHVLGADNRDPSWFDISHITNDNQADRIAYVTGPLFKAASNRVVGGAELAEMLGVEIPNELAENYAPIELRPLMKLAFALAELEQEFEKDERKLQSVRQSCLPPLDHATDLSSVTLKTAAKRLMTALTRHRVPVSVSEWLEMNGIPQHKSAAVVAALPGVYTRLCARLDIADKLDSLDAYAVPTSDEGFWAYKQAATRSLSLKHAQSRILSGMESPQGMVKKADVDDPGADELAQKYAICRLNQLSWWRDDPDFDFIARALVAQEYV